MAPPDLKPPDYGGGNLVNLVAELEQRLTGSSRSVGLRSDLADSIPEAATYVLVLFDGLGTHQLDHPAAAPFAPTRRGVLDAPFPTTTTVSLASVATGVAPARHGLLGYQLWIPELDQVANTIKWTTLWGEPLRVDFDAFLPGPNLWERLIAAGREPITVQPFNFAGSPMTRVLYRSCRFEPFATEAALVDATVDLATVPGRLLLVYLPHVDFTAHVVGQDSEQFREALQIVAAVWEQICLRIPPDAVAVGTADHGHVDVPPERRIAIARQAHTGRTFYGDSRAMFVRGREGAELAKDLPARWVPLDDMSEYWGPGPRHRAFEQRAPLGALFPDHGYALLHKHSDERLIGQHGGLSDQERSVPLLVSRE